MNSKGFVIHNSKRYDYIVDERGYIWIEIGMGKTNISQVRPVDSKTDIEKVVHQMLDAGGY